jgi:hypothetical protein
MVETDPRLPFEIRPSDRDYSGLSITGRYLASSDIEKSFFNGVNLTHCLFDNVKMNNTEFTEALIQRSDFLSSDLSGSDFVDCLLEVVAFHRCSFEKGEWRDTTFRRCKFVDCNFSHTTVTLCTFIKCEFDDASLARMAHRAAYFNVLSQCMFDTPTTDTIFSSRNFGVPMPAIRGGLVHSGAGTTIEQVCLLNNAGSLRALDIADVAENICASLAGGEHRRNSTLAFFSKIVRTVTLERRISATSLIYLEQIILRLGSTTQDQDVFMAAMAAVVEIRSALFSVASESTDQANAYPQGSARKITIYFSESYRRYQSEALRDALAETVGVSTDSIEITDVRPGSTLIELASTGLVSAGGLLVAVNFILRQAKVLVERYTAVEVAAAKRRKKRAENKAKLASKKARNKVPAVMKTGAVSPELAPVRAAVLRSGRVLVEMDEKAQVTILIEQYDGR